MVQLWATSKTTAHSRQQVALVPTRSPHPAAPSPRPSPQPPAPSPRGQPPSPQPPASPQSSNSVGGSPRGPPPSDPGGVFRNPEIKSYEQVKVF